MKLLTGKVIGGKIEVENDTLTEGSTVTVLVESDETFELTPAEAAELRKRIGEVARGEFIDGDAYLSEMAE